MDKAKIWAKFGAVAPYLFLVIYSLLGGLFFQLLEQRSMEDRLRGTLEEREGIKDSSATVLMRIFNESREENFTITIDDIKDELQNFGTDIGAFKPKEYESWSFWTAVFYSGTVYTTIGYGLPTAETLGGQIFTIVYAMIGIPLVLYNLSEMGKLFTYWIWKLYSLFNIFVLNKFRNRKNGKPLPAKQDDMSEFPFRLAIVITIVWMCLCALIFLYLESSWNYFQAFYFLFQSLTTIGFGDLVPRNPKFMVWSFMLILIGLALVSMCWNLVQLKLDALAAKTMKKIQETSTEEDETGQKNVDDMLAEENNVLGSLLSESRRARLKAQWEKKANQRNRGVQTELAMEDKDVQVMLKIWDSMSNLSGPQLPYIESRAKIHDAGYSSNDDFRGKLRELSVVLTECQSLMKNHRASNSTLSTGSFPTHV